MYRVLFQHQSHYKSMICISSSKKNSNFSLASSLFLTHCFAVNKCIMSIMNCVLVLSTGEVFVNHPDWARERECTELEKFCHSIIHTAQNSNTQFSHFYFVPQGKYCCQKLFCECTLSHEHKTSHCHIYTPTAAQKVCAPRVEFWKLFILHTSFWWHLNWLSSEGGECLAEEDLGIQLEEWEASEDKQDAQAPSAMDDSLLFESMDLYRQYRNIFNKKKEYLLTWTFSGIMSKMSCLLFL